MPAFGCVSERDRSAALARTNAERIITLVVISIRYPLRLVTKELAPKKKHTKKKPVVGVFMNGIVYRCSFSFKNSRVMLTWFFFFSQ